MSKQALQPPVKNERLYLRINGELKQMMERWAENHETTLSEVVTRFFQNLLDHERKERQSKEHQAAEKFF
jgi:hypothetical protein